MMEALVKTIVLKEMPMRYLIEVDRVTIEQGTTILQREGQPVAAIIPMGDYRAFQEWQDAQQKSISPVYPDFEAEVVAFERLKPELLEHYRGRAVAIYQGQVVEVGDNKMKVLARALERFGDAHCYVEWAEPDAPRRARIPSAWVAT